MWHSKTERNGLTINDDMDIINILFTNRYYVCRKQRKPIMRQNEGILSTLFFDSVKQTIGKSQNGVLL